jgi:hypothetical protein
VAAVATHILVFAAGPAVPGLFHDVAGVAKVGVILHVIIEMDKLVATERDDTKDNDHNRNSYLLGEFAYPMPEASYSGSEPIHHLCSVL